MECAERLKSTKRKEQNSHDYTKLFHKYSSQIHPCFTQDEFIFIINYIKLFTKSKVIIPDLTTSLMNN